MSGEKPAFPVKTADRFGVTTKPGLTKREYMATQIAAGLASHPQSMVCSEPPEIVCARTAVEFADALLEELEK